MPSNPEVLVCTVNAIGGWVTYGGGSIAKPDDGAATGIKAVGGGATIALLDVTNTTLTSETITSVVVRINTATLLLSDLLTISASDNGFTNQSSTSPMTTTTFTDYLLTMATKPSGGAWTVAAVNALQVRLTSSDTTTNQVTTATVEVSWTSGGASGTRMMLLGVG